MFIKIYSKLSKLMLSILLAIQAMDANCINLTLVDTPSKSITKMAFEEGVDPGLSKIYNRDYPKISMCHPYNSKMDTVPFVAFLDISKTILPQKVKGMLPNLPTKLFVVMQTFEEKIDTLFRPHYFFHNPQAVYDAKYNVTTSLTTNIYYPETDQIKPLNGAIQTHPSGADNMLVLSPNNLSLGVIPDNGAEFFSITNDGKVAALTYHILLPRSEANKVADIAHESKDINDLVSELFNRVGSYCILPSLNTYHRFRSLFFRGASFMEAPQIPTDWKNVVDSLDMKVFMTLNLGLIRDVPPNLNPDDLGRWWKWRAYFNLANHEGLPFMAGMRPDCNWRTFLETPEGLLLNENEKLIEIFSRNESPEKEFNMGQLVQKHLVDNVLKSQQK